MSYPDLLTMRALASLLIAKKFAFFESGEIALEVAPDTFVEVTGAQLAELTERGWVTLGEDDPELRHPRKLFVTESGRYWLDRYQKKLKGHIVILPGIVA